MIAWEILGWLVLAVVALIWVGGVWHVVWASLDAHRKGLSAGRTARFIVFGLIWPWGLGGVLFEWIRSNAP